MTEALAKYESRASALQAYNAEEIELIKTQIAPGTTDKELALFLTVANRRRLDAFKGQIFAIKRSTYDKAKGGYVDKMTIQIAHAGLLALAERTNGYRGTTDPQFASEDGVWTDVWLASKPPAACKVGVYRKGFAAPVMGVALWREYVQTTREGKPMGLWETKPTHMLEKCALSKALRRAFPDMEDADDQEYDSEPDEYAEAEPVSLRAVAIDDGADEPPYDPGIGMREWVDAIDHAQAADEPEPITLTNDATGETIVVPEPAAARQDDVIAKARAKLAPKTQPVASTTQPEPEITPIKALFKKVKAWAEQHGTDPNRLRFYMATAAGVPQAVSEAAVRAWLGSQPGNTLDVLYDRYVSGESGQQAAEHAASQQGGLGL